MAYIVSWVLRITSWIDARILKMGKQSSVLSDLLSWPGGSTLPSEGLGFSGSLLGQVGCNREESGEGKARCSDGVHQFEGTLGESNYYNCKGGGSLLWGLRGTPRFTL